MLTIRSAATLLTQADSLRALRALARALGFSEFRPLDRDARASLAIDAVATDAQLARADGTRRCVLAQLQHEASIHLSSPGTTTDPRELTRLLCLALARHAPARDWTVITLDHTTQIVCIAVVTSDARRSPTRALALAGPRVAALRVDRRRVVDSDADTLRSLASVQEPHSALAHRRFVDILGRDALSNRFYRALEYAIDSLATTASGAAPLVAKRELALLCASRCLFLAFLEAKGWLAHQRQFLVQHTTHRLERDGQLHDRFLRPLFFGTLNTPVAQRAARAREFGNVPFLNGGLFSPTPLERKYRAVRFADDAVATLIADVLDRYRFTAHEDSHRWSEAAVDPEMLGRAFECLMANDERHSSGSYYTPPTLVSTVVQDALAAALPSLPPLALHDDASLDLSPAQHARLSDQLHALRIVDPACGSGAFLVHTLETLAAIHTKLGDRTAPDALRRTILTRSLFGVDRNPMAVWLCELRLWLSIVIECPETRIDRIPPLPNLDHHVRVGDTLAGGDFTDAPHSARALTKLRERYTRATGARKHTLATALDHEERQRAIAECRRIAARAHHDRHAAISALRSRDLFGQRSPRSRADTQNLARLKLRSREATRRLQRVELGGALPFRFAAHFADVAGAGGFSVVIGNPPWVRPHALPVAERTRLRTEFRTMRHAAWRAGAKRAGAGAGFAAQADLSAAFVERSVQLLAPDGVAALLVPSKLWRTLAGGGVRELLDSRTHIRTVRDWSDGPAHFGAAVYPSLVVAQRRGDAEPMESSPSSSRVHVTVATAHGESTFNIAQAHLPLDHDPAAPWLLLPPRARTAFHTLLHAAPALGDSPLGRPTLGVKCGCNAAFLVHAEEHDDDTATVFANGRSAVIERALLRPVMRGDSVRTALEPGGATEPARAARIIWTHDAHGAPLRTLPPATTRWLAHWRSQLDQRRDARARQPWWSLFRTDAARFETPRVVWADIGRALAPRVLHAGDPTVPLNTCYVMHTASPDDAYALHALLASPVAASWFAAIAEPARGGFKRFMGWTVATLPTPRDWNRARITLAALGVRQHHGVAITQEEYLDVLAHAYDVAPSVIRILVASSDHGSAT